MGQVRPSHQHLESFPPQEVYGYLLTVPRLTTLRLPFALLHLSYSFVHSFHLISAWPGTSGFRFSTGLAPLLILVHDEPPDDPACYHLGHFGKNADLARWDEETASKEIGKYRPYCQANSSECQHAVHMSLRSRIVRECCPDSI